MADQKTQWFPHDMYAHSCIKLSMLLETHGMEAYGRYWIIIEMLRAQEGYCLDITTKFAYLVLGKRLMMEPTEAQDFIMVLVEEFQLLNTNGTYIWSRGLCDRMKYWDDRYESLRERGKKGAEARIRTLKERAKEEDEDEEAA